MIYQSMQKKTFNIYHDKNVSNLGLERNFLHVIKAFTTDLHLTSYLIVRACFPPRLGTRQDFPLSPLLFNGWKF